MRDGPCHGILSKLESSGTELSALCLRRISDW